MFGGRDNDRNPLIGLLMFIFAPIAASILQMALSRTREYAADRSGAEYTHDPAALASALSKLAIAPHRFARRQTMPPSTLMPTNVASVSVNRNVYSTL